MIEKEFEALQQEMVHDFQFYAKQFSNFSVEEVLFLQCWV